MEGVDYTTSIVEKYDAIHLMTPEDENKLNDAKENHVPVIVSALYCESDPVANYLEYKSKDGVRHTRLSDKALRFLNKADLVLVPSLKARDLLVDEPALLEGIKAGKVIIEALIPDIVFGFKRSLITAPE